MRKLLNRIEMLEAGADPQPFPLNLLVDKVPDSEFQFVKQNMHLDYFCIDTDTPEAERVRLILENAGVLPPLRFAQ